MNNVPCVLLVGAHGRMGRAVAAAATKEPGLTIKTELGRGDPITPGINGCDVVIDFSSANATEAVCRACAERRKALVLGTTGHNATQKTSVAAAARQIPIVFAANFSVGVNALFALTRRAAELLGTEFDVDVIEMHHRTKKDAPSGTAKRLVEILTDVGEANRLVATQSVRAGDIVGDHMVIFTGPGERLEMIHRATSRETFAAGALRAARWIIDQPAGLYSMENVLGF
jgi:4-hydroxy-tetrahydrodipicolinate reductase